MQHMSFSRCVNHKNKKRTQWIKQWIKITAWWFNLHIVYALYKQTQVTCLSLWRKSIPIASGVNRFPQLWHRLNLQAWIAVRCKSHHMSSHLYFHRTCCEDKYFKDFLATGAAYKTSPGKASLQSASARWTIHCCQRVQYCYYVKLGPKQLPKWK